ncbi:hypothetical protein KKC65_00700 [Patescibacteria group bacterium]|nr:hypothetical protein [Patescibacteria group bacterium]
MIKLLEKLKTTFKKPCVIIVAGDGGSFSVNPIFRVLEDNNCKIFNVDLSNFKQTEKSKSLLRTSKQSVLAISNLENRKEIARAKQIARDLRYPGYLVLHSDNENIKEMSEANLLIYGLNKKSDIQISDINVDENGTNFKVNHQGNSVPFWFKESLKRKEINNVLLAISVGIIKDINLVRISELLK